jgi:hypothetical protein
MAFMEKIISFADQCIIDAFDEGDHPFLNGHDVPGEVER